MSKIEIVYALEEAPEGYSRSIFAAGPTPRSRGVKSWRPDLIRELQSQGYEGVVFVPEARDGVYCGDYMAQVSWEEKYLSIADVILFWVPREMGSMPALTTNVEWGTWADSGRVVLGAPEEAVRNNYLFHYATKLHVPHSSNLRDLSRDALKMLGEGAQRSHGERDVPLMVWNTPSFQTWYQAQRSVGNELKGARLLNTFRVGEKREHIFSWTLHANIYIKSEDRSKTNEFVFSRPDISSTVLYHKGHDLLSTQVVLVKEFRSPVNNKAGFVYELPAGSALNVISPLMLAKEEVHEEAGLDLPLERFKVEGVRQVAATLATYRSHLFSVELTLDEIDELSKLIEPFGNLEDSERTYVEVHSLASILESELCDWSTLGMIMSVLKA